MKKLLKILMSLMLTLSMSAGFVFAEETEELATSTDDTTTHTFVVENAVGDLCIANLYTFDASFETVDAAGYEEGDTINLTFFCADGDGYTAYGTSVITDIGHFEATCTDDEYYIIYYEIDTVPNTVTVSSDGTVSESTFYSVSDTDIYDKYGDYLLSNYTVDIEVTNTGSATGVHSAYDSDGNLVYYLAQDDDGNFYVEILCAGCFEVLETVKDVTVTSEVLTTTYDDANGDFTIGENYIVYTYTFTYDGKEYTDTSYGGSVDDEEVTATSTSDDTSTSSDDSSSEDTSSSTSSDSVETADSTILAGYALIGLIALAGVAYLSKKEELQ